MNQSVVVNYEKAYGNLNIAQKEAVDTLDGPVMVIAGPGTGKTQVLALRIAHILVQTDTPANGILCLTFTRAGVKAMKERLFSYIGDQSNHVTVNTFHSFAIDLIEKNFGLLGFDVVPTVLDDTHAVSLVDELLHAHVWEHLRPRTNPTLYFNDLKSVISLLKRERLSPVVFLEEIEKDIHFLIHDESSLSTRGETKGQLKKEVQSKIESLEKTKEVVLFYERYELLKKERNVMDYDDVLFYAVSLVEMGEDIAAEIRENYLYVLVDEHQDSSGVQNAFLQAVWGDTEKPNLFVVGDDRQLIYGFSGASLSYFEDFKTTFGKAHLITLIENYRSSEPILSLADSLLKSQFATHSLSSNRDETHPVVLSEFAYPRDEILGAGLWFKEKIENNIKPESCVLLVPKNRHVRGATETLLSMGLPVQSHGTVSFFSLPETTMLLRVLHISVDPTNKVLLTSSLFDYISQIPPLVAHTFLQTIGAKNCTLEQMLLSGQKGGFFDNEDSVHMWAEKLSSFIQYTSDKSVLDMVHILGNQLLIDPVVEHDLLLRRIEIVRTFIQLATVWLEGNNTGRLEDFLAYISRLESYGYAIPLQTFASSKGISVMTLHASKGLEYDAVWIAHMNESTLMSQKRMAFSLPEKVRAHVEEKTSLVAKREVYVAITRAKQYCAISYARQSVTGSEQKLADIISAIKNNMVERSSEDTEKELVSFNPKVYTDRQDKPANDSTEELKVLVANTYDKRNVSVTLLNNFFECPWKWYFRNLLQLPDVKTESLIFGSAVHKVIELLLKGTVDASVASIELAMSNALTHEGLTQGTVHLTMVREGTTTVTKWISVYQHQLSKNYATERSLSYRYPAFPHLSLYGKIDLTERFPDDTIVVTDFKTGSSKTRGVIEKPDEENRLSSFMRQLAMYTFLIKGSEKTNDTVRSRLLFLEADTADKNALYETVVSQEEIDMLVEDISCYDTLLKTGEWINRPCYFKSFGGGSNTCEYCDRAKQIYKIV